MKYFRLSLRELRMHPGKYVPVYVQIIISILLFSFIVEKFCNAEIFLGTLNNFSKHTDVYLANITTNPVEVMGTLGEDGASGKCRELYDYIKDNAEICIQMQEQLDLNSDNTSEEVLVVNSYFCSIFQLKVKKGRMFLDNEFTDASAGFIPVIVGAGLAADYPVGTRMTYYVSYLDMYYQLEVVGVLEDSAYYLEPDSTYSVISLENIFLVPWMEECDITGRGYADVNLFNEMQIETDSEAVLNAISSKAAQLNLFDISFALLKEQAEYIKEYYTTVYTRDICMLAAILLFCVVGCSTMLVTYVRSNIRNFSVRIVCGARPDDMILVICFQALIPMLIGLGICAVCFASPVVFMFDLLYSLLLLIAVTLYPAITWKKLTVSQIFKRFD